MPRKCCVVGCSTRGERDNVKFFRFPVVELRRAKFQKLSEERQRFWVKAVKRKDLKVEALKHTSICSRHFISGVSAKLVDRENPDWIPTLNLGYTLQKNSKQDVERYNRLNKRRKIKVAFNSNQLDDSPTTFSNNNNMDAEVIENTSALKENGSQTDDFYYKEILNETLLKKCKELTKENDTLKKKMDNRQVDNFSFEALKHDKKTKYLTGFNDFDTFEIIFEKVKPFIPLVKNSKMKKFDIVLMTLMKIRLDLPFTFLSMQYKTSIKTISNLFHKTVIILHEFLKCFVFWPDKKAAAVHMPQSFKNLFKDRAPIIIDCFEVFCEKPGNYLARANTFSSYKHHHTLKYLIAISTFGSIVYISKAYGGRCSDKFIVENCGFLDLISEGDIILADRGFLIQTSVNQKHSRLIMPAFKNGKSQMEAATVENNRDIASIRIHVERVIGVLRQKFLIFTNRQPITAISKKCENNMYCDYILKIASAIINLNPSVIK